jgi:hypothetical protein
MPRSIRTITAAIAIAALAAPTALARPADTPPAVAKAAAAPQHKQELRSPHVIDAAAQQKKQDPIADIHAPLARAAARAARNSSGATAGGQYTPGAIPAVSEPRPITAARAVQAPDSSSGVSQTAIGLIAGSLLAIVAIAGLVTRTRRIGRTRIAE